MRPAILVFFTLLHAAAAAEPMKFSAALGALAERNLDLQESRADLRQAEAQNRGSLAAFLPTLTVQGMDQQYQKTPSILFTREQQGLLEGTINLFHGGSDYAALESSRANIDSERNHVRQAELDTEQTNVSLLIKFIQAQAQQNVASYIQKLNEDLATIEDTRFHHGLIPLQEAQKALVEKNNSVARLDDATSRLAEARHNLEVQLGSSEVEAAFPWRGFLTVKNAEQWLKREFKLTDTPAWQRAVATIETQRQLEKARFRDYLPKVDLQVGWGYIDYTIYRQPGWETLLTLSIPLFDFKKTSDYQVQVQQEAIARIAAERTKRSLTEQWQETKEKLIVALKSVQDRDASMKMAQSLYDDNQRRLRAGRSSMNDILVDQNRLADAETLDINGWADAHLLYAQFCHSLAMRPAQDHFGCL